MRNEAASARPREGLAGNLEESLEEAVEAAVSRSQDYLFAKQQEGGYWIEEVEANTDLSAEYIFLMHMFGRVDEVRQRKICKYLLKKQKDDGSWPLHHSGEGHLSSTIEAYAALKLAGHDPDAIHMAKARLRILEGGGLSKARVFTKIHFAMMGLYDWEGTPCLPPWFVLLPPSFPFNIYEMSSWARACVVPLTILLHYKKEYPMREGFTLDELFVEGRANVDHSYKFSREDRWGNFFILADRILKRMKKAGLVPFARRGLREAERWILDHQDTAGDWGGIIPAMSYSILALDALGYSANDPVMRRGWEAVERLGIEDDERGWRLQPCVSPVWDTALTVWAMKESDADPRDARLREAGEWLLDRQILRYGDWKIKNKTGQPGGWCFEFYNDYYPDTDDTAAIMLGLDGLDMGDKEPVKKAACDRAMQWILSMQSKGGGWGAFDVDNDLEVMNKIPFADHGAMLDPNTPDLSGKIIEMLGTYGLDRRSEPVKKCVDFIKKEQHPEGPWFGRWGVNYIYGCCGVLSGLEKAGEDMQAPYVRQAVEWLQSRQNEDGGWGETCDSYDDESLMGVGPSTASQTAWALIALISAGEADSSTVRRGIEYLVKQQARSGEWKEEEWTGTGFPGHYYLRYHGYRNCFPLMALGRYMKFLKARRG